MITCDVLSLRMACGVLVIALSTYYESGSFNRLLWISLVHRACLRGGPLLSLATVGSLLNWWLINRTINIEFSISNQNLTRSLFNNLLFYVLTAHA